MDKTTIDEKCTHVPKTDKGYKWELPELGKTLEMKHCNKCHTDYCTNVIYHDIYIKRGYKSGP